MVQITEELVRKRAEHNNFELSTLEEVSLHQQDIEKIENIDKWCRNLKILYLQSNLIAKIENVSRLKKLEYFNLALNNITKIENLNGCESLNKLDLTVNFVAELSSIESLKNNHLLSELYLTGNPCTQYDGYREYVIATLPQLKRLDGKEIEKSERIAAFQQYAALRDSILQQQEVHRKNEARKEKNMHMNESKGPGNDGRWYTDIESNSKQDALEVQDDKELTEEEKERLYWSKPSEYTPESRIEMHNHIKEREELKSKSQNKYRDSEPPRREVRYFKENGEALNVNTAKLQFTLKDDEQIGSYVLDVACYKHLDTSLIDVDVQPKYVKVNIKGQILQLALMKEVNPDKSAAQRSQTTGHLLVKMPIAGDFITPKTEQKSKNVNKNKKIETAAKTVESSLNNLNLDNIKKDSVSLSDLAGIVKHNGEKQRNSADSSELLEDDFVDDPDVPPLI